MQLAETLNVSTRKVDRVKRRFVEHGLNVALNKRKADRQRFRKIDGDTEAHLVALSCSKPPEGHVRWTLRMLADKLVELEYVDSISYETVRRALKKRIKTMAKGTMGYSARTKRRFCCANGVGA